MTTEKLAIVIPAYKIDYFDFSLRSLANQTDKRFTVYVGIDASPYNFECIIDKYKSIISISYERFSNNLGGTNLVAQWDRCLSLIGNEQWVWLFSDDDVMEPTCIESFYKELENYATYDLYHFNVDIIGENNEIIKKTQSYPNVISAVSFLKKKNTAKIDSFVVEYIFRRSIFENLGGFQYFDLAWGTDIATWAKIGRDKGIKTISGSKVLWRQSSLNITPSNEKGKLKRKLSSNVSFFLWCRSNFNEISNSDIYYYMFRMLFHYTPFLSVRDFKDIVSPLYNNSFKGKMCLLFITQFYPLLRLIHQTIHLRKI